MATAGVSQAGAAGDGPAAARSPQLLAARPVVCLSHGFQINYERGFCNGLAAQGAAVTLVSSDRTDRTNLLPAVRTVNLRGSQDEDRPRWLKAANQLRYHLAVMAYALLRRRATLHVIGLLVPLVWCGVLQGLWFRLVCRRYVLTVHDVLPHDAHTEWNHRLCRIAYRLPHRLVVHTPRMRDTLVADFGIAAANIVVMEHGIEPRANRGPEAAPQTDPALPLLLAFGIVVPRKGTDILLEALRGLSFPVRLVIAGHCPDAMFRAQLKALIAAHPLRERIEWLDRFVREDEVEALFTEAAVALLPYHYIDQSGVLFQALRFGTPVVATKVGQFERYVGADVGELAEPGDADSLRQALERWGARRQALSREHIAAIGRGYEWPITVLALRAAYP